MDGIKMYWDENEAEKEQDIQDAVVEQMMAEDAEEVKVTPEQFWKVACQVLTERLVA